MNVWYTNSHGTSEGRSLKKDDARSSAPGNLSAKARPLPQGGSRLARLRTDPKGVPTADNGQEASGGGTTALPKQTSHRRRLTGASTLDNPAESYRVGKTALNPSEEAGGGGGDAAEDEKPSMKRHDEVPGSEPAVTAPNHVDRGSAAHGGANSDMGRDGARVDVRVAWDPVARGEHGPDGTVTRRPPRWKQPRQSSRRRSVGRAPELDPVVEGLEIGDPTTAEENGDGDRHGGTDTAAEVEPGGQENTDVDASEESGGRGSREEGEEEGEREREGEIEGRSSRFGTKASTGGSERRRASSHAKNRLGSLGEAGVSEAGSRTRRRGVQFAVDSASGEPSGRRGSVERQVHAAALGATVSELGAWKRRVAWRPGEAEGWMPARERLQMEPGDGDGGPVSDRCDAAPLPECLDWWARCQPLRQSVPLRFCEPCSEPYYADDSSSQYHSASVKGKTPVRCERCLAKALCIKQVCELGW